MCIRDRYMRMLRWLSKKTGVSQYEYDIRSFSDHSWCSIVEYKSCNSQEELREYYKRLGVQLFLTYFLSTKDLHYENIIACGEYPVSVSYTHLMRILPGYCHTSIPSCMISKRWIARYIKSIWEQGMRRFFPIWKN